jgi:hypothetical protein
MWTGEVYLPAVPVVAVPVVGVVAVEAAAAAVEGLGGGEDLRPGRPH